MQTARLALAAAAFGTVGGLIPLVMMVNGVIVHDIDYFWWTWPAIPAVWAPLIFGAWLSRSRPLPGAMLITLAATAGLTIFRNELSWLTFGPAWLLGLTLYLTAGRDSGLLGGHAPTDA